MDRGVEIDGVTDAPPTLVAGTASGFDEGKTANECAGAEDGVTPWSGFAWCIVETRA